MKPSRRGFFALFAALPAAALSLARRPARPSPCPVCGAPRVAVWSPSRPWIPAGILPCEACALREIRGLTIRFIRDVDTFGNVHNRVDAYWGHPFRFDQVVPCVKIGEPIRIKRPARYAWSCGGHNPG